MTDISKCRIYYDDNNEVVSVEFFNNKKFTDSDLDSARTLTQYSHLNSKIVNISDVQQDHEYTNQMYVDGENIVVDTNKEKTVMPDRIVKAKHMSKIRSEIEEEMGKDSPDSLVIAKKQAEFDICRRNDDEIFWKKKALSGLDRVVAEGGQDKSVIRKKLNDRILELEGTNDN